MNCQTFRQYCTLNPTYREQDFLRHKQACSACADFADDMMRFEQTLVEAMKIETPAGLTERILQRQTIPSVDQRLLTPVSLEGKKIGGIFKVLKRYSPSQFASQWFHYPIYALAASLVLVIGLLVGSLWWQSDVLPQQVIAYIENDPHAFLMNGEVPTEEVRGMFQAIGAELTGDIGQVNFCQLLTLQDYASAHLVLSGTKGPVNVLFIRDSQSSGPQSFKHGELKSLILSASWGNLAIVGFPEEPLETIANRINEAVIWL